MKIIEETEKYAVITREGSEVVTSKDEEIHNMPGKAYNVGAGYTSDPQTEKIHEVTCHVLKEWGFEVDDQDVILIKDMDWAATIDEEINGLLKS